MAFPHRHSVQRDVHPAGRSGPHLADGLYTDTERNHIAAIPCRSGGQEFVTRSCRRRPAGLLPPRPPGPVSDRLRLRGILFVLHKPHGLATPAPGAGFRLGADVPAPAGPVAGGGSFDPSRRAPRAEPNGAGELDWSCACMDGSHTPAKKGRRQRPGAGRPAPDGQQTPSDLRRRGTPLNVVTTAAHVDDVTRPPALVYGVHPSRAAPAGPADDRRAHELREASRGVRGPAVDRASAHISGGGMRNTRHVKPTGSHVKRGVWRRSPAGSVWPVPSTSWHRTVSTYPDRAHARG